MPLQHTFKELLSLENNPTGEFFILQRIAELHALHEWVVVGQEYYNNNTKQFKDYYLKGSFTGTLQDCLKLKDSLAS